MFELTSYIKDMLNWYLIILTLIMKMKGEF